MYGWKKRKSTTGREKESLNVHDPSSSKLIIRRFMDASCPESFCILGSEEKKGERNELRVKKMLTPTSRITRTK